MLSKAEVNRVRGEVQGVFDAPCSIHVTNNTTGVYQYEIVLYAPYLQNIGRGSSLQSALNMLKQRNGK